MNSPVDVLTLLGPWPLWLPLFCLALFIFRCESRQVASVMREYGHCHFLAPDEPCVKRHLWLHAIALSTILMLASVSKPFELVTSCLFTLFIFRMSLIDALTGWLPREFTWPFLAAGLCVASGNHVLSSHAALSFILLSFGWFIRKGGGALAQREVLGMGDVWFAAGLGAWFDAPVLMFSLMGGVAGFTFWHAGSQDANQGGPLGPWLGYSALLAMAFNVSEPLFMW
ncbi:prepilin peptidase [Rahnella sp. BCC 1045]|uniref:prepilin peptidase n=1 Tax=Rahnella sp. BCC 1045 TaxID=2816251 RepID=UPI001C269AE2|nr:A24 family peptidase [Rahnella sp. BCC 1045]MBU9819875.1 prepilin peptidase [Rahnella sp. BCC 1045]